MLQESLPEDTVPRKKRYYLNGSKLAVILALKDIDISKRNDRYDLPSPTELGRMISGNSSSIEMLAKVLCALRIPPSAIDAEIILDDYALSLIYRDKLHSDLIGKWIIHHRTAPALASSALAVGELVIAPNSSCTLSYLTDKRLSFSGHIIPETNGRFVLMLDCTGDINHIERRIFRGEVPFDGAFSTLDIIWLGVGRGRGAACGNVTMVKVKEELTSEQRQKLDAHAAESIASLASSWLDERPDQEDEGVAETIHTSWIGGKLFPALAASSPGETHYLLSSCYPSSEFARLIDELERLRDNRAKRFKPNDPNVKIVILLLKTDSSAISEGRFSHYPNPDDATGTEFRKVIYNQARELLALGKISPSYLDLEVHMYDGWVFGHYFRIGDRMTFFSPLLATKSAVSSLMIISSHPDSRIWKKLLDSWTVTFKKAIHIKNIEELDRISGQL